MTVSLRAEISQEEYAEIRVAALQAGVSTQAFLGRLIRDGFDEHRANSGPPLSMKDATKLQHAKNEITAQMIEHSPAAPSLDSLLASGALKKGSEVRPVPDGVDPETGEIVDFHAEPFEETP